MTVDRGREPARDVILGRIRETAVAPPAEIPRDYLTSLAAGVDIVERFTERVADYRANVHRASPATIGAVVAAALGSRGARSLVVPAGLPEPWLAGLGEGFERRADEPALSHARLDGIDAVVTGCAVAIAETGTIVLDAGPGQGRRVLSLLPDCHVCVVRTDQVVGEIAEALARLEPRRPLTWISGPSATSDIELDRVEGVHGPRKLDVVILG
ncbi:MAG TPA: lactate utilization protein C [Candidatus Limnocylindrales bacterium]